MNKLLLLLLLTGCTQTIYTGETATFMQSIMCKEIALQEWCIINMQGSEEECINKYPCDMIKEN